MKKLNICRKKIIMAVVLLLSGSPAVSISAQYKKHVVNIANQTAAQADLTKTRIQPLAAETNPESILAELVAEVMAEGADDGFIPNVVQLNLAYYYPEGSDETNPLDSTAGAIFRTLIEKDENWLSNLYDLSDITPSQMAARLGKSGSSVLGKYNPNDERHDPNKPETWSVNSFKKVHMYFKDGDGNISNGYSNVIPIMSMASVYTWFHDMEDEEAFLEYALNLWEHSHSYTVSMGGIYYCEGCLGGDSDARELEALMAEEALERATAMAGMLYGIEILETAAESITKEPACAETQAGQDMAAAEETTVINEGIQETAASKVIGPAGAIQASLASDSNASEAEAETAAEVKQTTCPGHVDLYIMAKVVGVEEKNSLFTLDSIGNNDSNQDTDEWSGWDTYTKSYATRLSKQDWYERYGLTVSSLFVRNPLTESEIEDYMDQLPAHLSQQKRDMIYFALSSVGKIPYYWGGKAASASYSGNQFGTLVQPDENGRILRGLDCSGWINWVYWSTTGTKLSYESTSGLALCGTRINYSELEPGDIIIRTGTNAHVVMFLGWTEDGRVLCIQETSGNVNNVTVSVRDANWPYCRRLID